MQVNGWANLNVSQFCELQTVKFEDYPSETDYFCNIVSIVEDKALDEIYEYPLSKLKQTRESFSFIQHPPKNRPKDLIEVEGETLYLLPNLNLLSVGEFIDLEQFVTNNYYDHFKLILAVLYRRRIKEETPFFPAEYEPYGNYIFIRQPLFEEQPITNVYGAVKYYLSWRDKIYNSYAALFTGGYEDITQEELDQADGATRAELIREQAFQSKLKKWSWHLFLDRICEVYGCDEEKATNFNLITVLNKLSRNLELNG